MEEFTRSLDYKVCIWGITVEKVRDRCSVYDVVVESFTLDSGG